MEKLTEKYVHDHSNALVKIKLPFKRIDKEPSKEDIREGFRTLEGALEYSRVDRRNSRVRADWLNDVKLAKVAKIVKKVVNFGFMQNKEKYLYPEEVLFLLETNRLELFENNVPVSLEKAYHLVLNTTDVTINRFRVFKKLASYGYKVTRYSNEKQSKRPSDLNNENNEAKKKKLKAEESTSEEKRIISNIFDRLQSIMPKTVINSTDVTPHYCVTGPATFKLYVCEKPVVDTPVTSQPMVYGICRDDVIFYKFRSVNTNPNLI